MADINYREILPHDVGQAHFQLGRAWPVKDFMGAIVAKDVGKRVYVEGDHVRLESDDAYARRRARVAAPPPPVSTPSDEHSAEPWTPDDDTVTAKAGRDTIVVAYAQADIYTPKRKAKANARRIAACVNACRGIPTEALQQMSLRGLVGGLWGSLSGKTTGWALEEMALQVLDRQQELARHRARRGT